MPPRAILPVDRPCSAYQHLHHGWHCGTNAEISFPSQATPSGGCVWSNFSHYPGPSTHHSPRSLLHVQLHDDPLVAAQKDGRDKNSAIIDFLFFVTVESYHMLIQRPLVCTRNTVEVDGIPRPPLKGPCIPWRTRSDGPPGRGSAPWGRALGKDRTLLGKEAGVRCFQQRERDTRGKLAGRGQDNRNSK